MSNLEKYNEVFCKAFSLQPGQLGGELVYQSIPAWDSIGHMEMVADLEDMFDISFEAEDIIDFNSYHKGMELLKKYGITFD